MRDLPYQIVGVVLLPLLLVWFVVGVVLLGAEVWRTWDQPASLT